MLLYVSQPVVIRHSVNSRHSPDFLPAIASLAVYLPILFCSFCNLPSGPQPSLPRSFFSFFRHFTTYLFSFFADTDGGGGGSDAGGGGGGGGGGGEDRSKGGCDEHSIRNGNSSKLPPSPAQPSSSVAAISPKHSSETSLSPSPPVTATVPTSNCAAAVVAGADLASVAAVRADGDGSPVAAAASAAAAVITTAADGTSDVDPNQVGPDGAANVLGVWTLGLGLLGDSECSFDRSLVGSLVRCFVRSTLLY